MYRTRCEPGDVAFIYRLVDPTTGRTRYVGMTYGTPLHHHWGEQQALARRLDGHLRSLSGSIEKIEWFLGLRRQGITPRIECLETVPFDHGLAAERKWIHYLRNRGEPLFNRFPLSRPAS